jgi:hypothetical protein
MTEPKKHVVHVMLDTNVVFVNKSMHHACSRTAETLIADSETHEDLAMRWMIPAMVRSERIWQMRGFAVEQLAAVRSMQRLFGQVWVENDDAIVEAVKKRVDEQLHELGVNVIECDVPLVDWTALISAAARRLPPFSPGESEKGFRDAIICETFCQQIGKIQLNDDTCIVVSGDDLLRKAVAERLGAKTPVRIVKSLDELKNEINFLASPIDAETAQALALKAGEVFEKSGLWKTFRDQLFSEFASELRMAPPDVDDVRLGQSWLSLPVFIRKRGSRLEFASIFTCERVGRKWVWLNTQPPLDEGARLLASLLDLGQGSSLDDTRRPDLLQSIAGMPTEAQPLPPPPQDPGMTLAALANHQPMGRFETVPLPELHFSFIWSAEYDSTGLISNPRNDRIVAEPL